MKRVRGVRLAATLLPSLAAALAYAWGLRALGEKAEANDEPYRPTVRYFGKGGPSELREALIQTGAPPDQATSIVRAVARRLGAGYGSFVVVASTTGSFHHVTTYRGRRKAVIGRGSHGVTAGAVEEQLKQIQGTVKGSLLESLAAAGVPPELSQELLDIFRWTLDPSSDPQDGDRFRLICTQRISSGLVLGRRLEAASYEGNATGRMAAVRFDDDFFDKSGQSLRRPFLRVPLRYRVISSAFGKFRFSGLGWPMRRHRGTDYTAHVGTPIICVADGRVDFVGVKPNYGNLVRVRHTGSRETVYGHMSRFGPGIRKGAAVRQGQVLGYVGTTGNATGPHLHFELRRDGEMQDFRAAGLPDEPLKSVSRPARFRARWRQLFETSI